MSRPQKLLAGFALTIALLATTLAVPLRAEFIRGDSNGDALINLIDAIVTLNFLAVGGPMSCLDAADVTDNGVVNVVDAVHTLAFLFSGTVPPPTAPYPACGDDPTADSLDCVASAACP